MDSIPESPRKEMVVFAELGSLITPDVNPFYKINPLIGAPAPFGCVTALSSCSSQWSHFVRGECGPLCLPYLGCSGLESHRTHSGGTPRTPTLLSEKQDQPCVSMFIFLLRETWTPQMSGSRQTGCKIWMLLSTLEQPALWGDLHLRHVHKICNLLSSSPPNK